MLGVFNPKRFLELGTKLIVDPDYDENTRLRTAMSRIYYAAFLVAQSRLVRAGIRIRDITRAHQEVIDAYMDHGFTNIGSKLDQMREMRRHADYEMANELVTNTCKYYAQMSQLTIQLIEGIQAFH